MHPCTSRPSPVFPSHWSCVIVPEIKPLRVRPVPSVTLLRRFRSLLRLCPRPSRHPFTATLLVPGGRWSVSDAVEWSAGVASPLLPPHRAPPPYAPRGTIAHRRVIKTSPRAAAGWQAAAAYAAGQFGAARVWMCVERRIARTCCRLCHPALKGKTPATTNRIHLTELPGILSQIVIWELDLTKTNSVLEKFKCCKQTLAFKDKNNTASASILMET